MSTPASAGETAPDARDSVTVVIPSYNMAWCIERAIASCASQTRVPDEIVVVDDCSTDDTSDVVSRLMQVNGRIRYHRLARNGGHLAALLHGLQASTKAWVALLDADDELTADSLELRLEAARRHRAASGEWPELVYGDVYVDAITQASMCRYKRIEGRDYAYLTRELSLCQTSTIMLGRAALGIFPETTNPYNTDDEIVLAVAKHYPLAHAGAPVTVTHNHPSETRMTNSSHRRLRGITQLVRDHRRDIIRDHGMGRYSLWLLRIVRATLEWQNDVVAKRLRMEAGMPKWRLLPLRLYGRLVRSLYPSITRFLGRHFEHLYF